MGGFTFELGSIQCVSVTVCKIQASKRYVESLKIRPFQLLFLVRVFHGVRMQPTGADPEVEEEGGRDTDIE